MTSLRSSFVLAAAAVGLIACGPERVTFQPQSNDPATASSGAEQQIGTGQAVAEGTAAEQIEQLDVALATHGFGPVGAPLAGSLPTHGIVAYLVEAQAGRCYTIVAIGESEEQNLTLVVLDPLGREAGHDVRGDRHPWVSFCAATAGRYIARLQMPAGQGGYVYHAYEGPSDRRLTLNDFFGSDTVRDEGPSVAVATRIETHEASFRSRGYQRVGEPAGRAFTAGEESRFALNVQPGNCYAFAVFGDDGADRADIGVHDGSGTRIAGATSPARDADTEFCAQGDAGYALSVRLVEGAGRVYMVGYRRTANGGLESPNAEPVIDQVPDAELEENFALLDADMVARGYENVGTSSRGRLGAGGTQRVQFDLVTDRCYALVAVGDRGVTDIDLTLRNPAGQVIDTDIGDDARTTLRACIDAGGRYAVDFAMQGGEGAFVYALYKWPRGTTGPFGLSGRIYLRLAEMTALLSVEGYAPDPGFTPESGSLGSVGATGVHPVTLQAGQCYAVVVVGGESVRNLDVSLALNGAEVADDGGTQNPFPSVRHCAEASGQYQFTVTAAEGTGAYHAQVFSQGT